MLPAVGSAEGEFALRGAALGDDAVVVIEGLFDGDEDTRVAAFIRVGFDCVVPCLGVVVPWAC